MAGENNPDAPSVKKRRAELDAEAKGEKRDEKPAGQGLFGGSGKTEEKGAAEPPADAPPDLDDEPATDPLEGFTEKSTAKGVKMYWKKPLKKWYTREDVLAGKAIE